MRTFAIACLSVPLFAALVTAASEMPQRLRIVTINVLHGGLTSELAGDGERLEERLGMVTRELRTLDADVVGLQEASRGPRRGDVAGRLADALGYAHVFAPATHRWPLAAWVLNLDEGPAVLSRFPIASSKISPVEGCGGSYRRMLVCAELATPGGSIDACSTHLDGSDCQAKAVADVLRGRSRAAPLVLVGDFNATESSEGIRRLIAALGFVDTFRAANPAAPGFTVWQPVGLERPIARRRVDYVFVAPGAGGSVRVLTSRLVFDAPSRTDGVLWPSDHHGVLTDVEFVATGG